MIELRRWVLAGCVASFSVSCSTVRLTPSAAAHLERGDTAEKAQAELDRTTRELSLARTAADRVLGIVEQSDELRKSLSRKLGLAETSDVGALATKMYVPTTTPPQDAAATSVAQRAVLAQQVVDFWWSGAFNEVEPGVDDRFELVLGKRRPTAPADSMPLPPLVSNEQRIRFLETQVRDQEMDVDQLRLVETGLWEYFVDGSVYFSIEPLVAIRPDVRAVAIPSIAVNYRPYDIASTWGEENSIVKGLSALAFQLTLGGALNPGSGTDGETEGAIGCGLSLPVANIGALSFGCVWFADDDDSHAAPYVSLILGDFGQSTTPGAEK